MTIAQIAQIVGMTEEQLLDRVILVSLGLFFAIALYQFFKLLCLCKLSIKTIVKYMLTLYFRK